MISPRNKNSISKSSQHEPWKIVRFWRARQDFTVKVARCAKRARGEALQVIAAWSTVPRSQDKQSEDGREHATRTKRATVASMQRQGRRVPLALASPRRERASRRESARPGAGLNLSTIRTPRNLEPPALLRVQCLYNRGRSEGDSRGGPAR